MSRVLDEALYARRLSWEDARSMEGGTIDFKPDDEAEAWVTLEVHEVRERASPPGTHQFSIFFRSRHEPHFAQGTYRFRHARLGEYAIFMTPIGRGAEGVVYQAAFARDD